MLALVSSLVLGLAACGDKKEDEKPVVETPVVDVEPEKEPEVEEEKEPVVVSIEDIVNYDYTKGYPDKISLNE